jgi:hypothetical protein
MRPCRGRSRYLGNQADRKSVEEIRGLLEDINRAWLHNRTDELENLFHRNIVIAQPGLEVQVRGKQACINSYKEFASFAAVSRFEASDHVIDVWGRAAVAKYRFEMDYEIQGMHRHDVGIDLFVLVHEDEKWLVVWRTTIPLASRKDGQPGD